MRGSIRPLPGGRWRLVVPAGINSATGRPRQIVRHVTGPRSDAEARLARLLVEVGAGAHDGHSVTLDELVDAWLEVARLSVATRRDYISARRHIPERLRRTPIYKIRPYDLDALYARLANDGLGPDRIRRVHSIVRSAFGQAIRWQWIARNPATNASPPPPPDARPNPPTVEQVRALIAHADPELRTWLRVEAGVGARRGEMCALQWGDVDFDRSAIVIRRALADGGPGVGIVSKPTKSANEYTVAIDQATVAVLREHRRLAIERALAVGATLDASSYLFAYDPESRAPWRPDSVTKRFARLRTRLDLPSSVKLKDLRHFVITQLLAAGVDPRTVAGRAGHKRTSTTLDIYAAFVPARDRDAADLLGRLLGDSSG